MQGDDDMVYNDIEKICTVIVTTGKAVLKGRIKETAKVQCRPKETQKSESQNGGYKLDATQTLLKSTGVGRIKPGKRYASDDRTNFEFKKNAKVDEINMVCAVSQSIGVEIDHG